MIILFVIKWQDIKKLQQINCSFIKLCPQVLSLAKAFTFVAHEYLLFL